MGAAYLRQAVCEEVMMIPEVAWELIIPQSGMGFTRRHFFRYTRPLRRKSSRATAINAD